MFERLCEVLDPTYSEGARPNTPDKANISRQRKAQANLAGKKNIRNIWRKWENVTHFSKLLIA